MNNKKFLPFVMLIFSIIISGCSKVSQSNIIKPNNINSQNDTNNDSNIDNIDNANNQNLIYTISDNNFKITYDDSYYYTDYKNENPVDITLNNSNSSANGNGVKINNSNITITKAGTYVLTGNLDDGNIIVDTDEKSDVHLVLNGVNINCSNTSAIYVKKAKQVVISLVEKTNNNISDGNKYIFEDNTTDEPNATIFSKSDLIFNGTGTLNVTANYNNGIRSKDNLIFMEGTYNVNAISTGISGKDLLAFKSGNFNINSENDAIKSTNSDENMGITYIEDGAFNLSAKDDALKAENILYIYNGNIDISSSYEGLEAKVINIYGGNIKIISTDDGINAAESSTSNENGFGDMESFTNNKDLDINIYGGIIKVNANGDGMDSNGSIYMYGGEVYVDGPSDSANGALDYNGEFIMSDGILVAVGSAGMTQCISDNSTIYCINAKFDTNQSANTEILVKNSNDKTILSYTSEKSFQSAVIALPELKNDETYSIYSNNNKLNDVTISDIIMNVTSTDVTTGNQDNQMGFHGRGGNFKNHHDIQNASGDAFKMDKGNRPNMDNASGNAFDMNRDQRPERPDNNNGNPPELPNNDNGNPPEFRGI